MTPDQKLVLKAVKDLTRNHGRCAFTVQTIEKESGIPAKLLWDWDNDAGILQDLSDDGYIVIDRGEDPLIELDSECLC